MTARSKPAATWIWTCCSSTNANACGRSPRRPEVDGAAVALRARSAPPTSTTKQPEDASGSQSFLQNLTHTTRSTASPRLTCYVKSPELQEHEAVRSDAEFGVEIRRRKLKLPARIERWSPGKPGITIIRPAISAPLGRRGPLAVGPGDSVKLAGSSKNTLR